MGERKQGEHRKVRQKLEKSVEELKEETGKQKRKSETRRLQVTAASGPPSPCPVPHTLQAGMEVGGRTRYVKYRALS